jgi:16S rRNA (guanine1516-N2)-methyltransferase
LGDAITLLPQCQPPDVIYLDPMFPTRKKSALSKKEMVNFKTIVGEDPDATLLLKTALACARSRVVIKRPRITENLTGSPAPSFSLTGSSCRFDVYLT